MWLSHSKNRYVLPLVCTYSLQMAFCAHYRSTRMLHWLRWRQICESLGSSFLTHHNLEMRWSTSKCAYPNILALTRYMSCCRVCISLGWKWDFSVQNSTLYNKPVPSSRQRIYHTLSKCTGIHEGVNINTYKYGQLAPLHSEHGDTHTASDVSALKTQMCVTSCRKTLITLCQKSRANPLLPQKVEPLCPDSALIYLHYIAGSGYYLNLLPDSKVDDEAHFAFGVMRSWQRTHESIRSFVCFCLRNWTLQWGSHQCLEPYTTQQALKDCSSSS